LARRGRHRLLRLLLLFLFLLGLVFLQRFGDRVRLGFGLRLGLGLCGFGRLGWRGLWFRLGFGFLDRLRRGLFVLGRLDFLFLGYLGGVIFDLLLLADFFHERLGRVLLFRGLRSSGELAEFGWRDDVNGDRIRRHRFQRRGREGQQRPQQRGRMRDTRYGE